MTSDAQRLLDDLDEGAPTTPLPRPTIPTLENAIEDAADAGYSPVTWRHLTTAEEAAALEELRMWLEWLRGRYLIDDDALPPCWAAHGALVEEYSALHTAWLVCFDERDNGMGPLQWHERFAQATDRLRKAKGYCTHREHTLQTPPAPWPTPTSSG